MIPYQLTLNDNSKRFLLNILNCKTLDFTIFILLLDIDYNFKILNFSSYKVFLQMKVSLEKLRNALF